MRLNARLNAEQATHLAGIQQQTNQSVSEIIRQALEMYYQAVCQQPVAAKEILSKNGFVGGFEADPELSTSYKTQLQQSLAENMILADTGFWLALANRRDHFHQRAAAALAELSEPLVTTWPMLTETCHLLLHRLGSQAQQQFLEGADAGAFQLHPNSPQELRRMRQLMQKYQDLPMDLADASLVLLAEHPGHGRILSTDQRDFETYRWKQHHPFENLL